MPHKMNARSCGRVGGMQVLLRGYLTMAADSLGRPVERGASSAPVRRVALPDAFFTFDGMCETFLTVLDEFGAFPAMIERELGLPAVPGHHPHLMVRARSVAARPPRGHQENAVGMALDTRERGAEQNLIERLASDERLPMNEQDLHDALADRKSFIGAAESQVSRVLDRVASIVQTHPDAAAYTPGEIL